MVCAPKTTIVLIYVFAILVFTFSCATAVVPTSRKMRHLVVVLLCLVCIENGKPVPVENLPSLPFFSRGVAMLRHRHQGHAVRPPRHQRRGVLQQHSKRDGDELAPQPGLRDSQLPLLQGGRHWRYHPSGVFSLNSIVVTGRWHDVGGQGVHPGGRLRHFEVAFQRASQEHEDRVLRVHGW